MRKQVILTIILCLSTFVVAYPQQFDKASAEFFWKVVDKLKQDKPLTDSLWKEFRSKYAHRNWLERHNKGWSERYEPGYRKALAIVFRPSLAAQRDSILRIPEPKEFLPKDDSWSFTDMHVREIYNSYFKDEDEIRAFYANKLDSNYLDTIYRIATTMLPTDFEKPTKKLDTLTIYIHGISSAASAGSYGIMFSMSLLYSREKNNLGNLGSHELHHILRESFIKNSIAKEDLYAVTAMEQTLNEGSADLLSTDYEGFDDWVDYNTTDSDNST